MWHWLLLLYICLGSGWLQWNLQAVFLSVIPSNKNSDNKGKFNSCLVCLGTLKDCVINLDGTFNDSSSQSKMSGAFLTPCQSILGENTFGQTVSFTIKCKHPINAHCSLSRLIVLADLTTHFTRRRVFKQLASMRRPDKFFVACQVALLWKRIEHELFSLWV